MFAEIGVNPPTPNPAHNLNFSLLSVLKKERLTGPNYMDWMRNLKFTLRYENKEYILDEQIPTIDDDSTQEEIEAHQKHYNDANKAKASKERLDVVKSLMACKLKPRASICAFVLEVKGYFDRLESLNMVFDAKLSINIILSAHVLTVGHNAKKRKTSPSNWKGKAAKGKFDHGSKRNDESEIAPTSNPKEAVCFHYNIKGHWKRSCPKYMKDLKDGKVKKVVTQGLKESRRLKHGELNLVMGNRKITHVTRIGKYELMLKYQVRIEDSFGYLFYKPKDNVVFIAQSGVLLERELISKEDSRKVVTLVKANDIYLPIHRTSGRVNKPPQFYYGFHIEEDKTSDSKLSKLYEPANYKEAKASPKAAKWKKAMKSEIQSMCDNQVWSLVDTTPGLKMVGCKWILKKKTDINGKIHTYKARLVVKGYTQTHVIDYEETFSPVAKIKMSRVPYAVDIGLIMYAMTCTRPDIYFALSMSGWIFLLNEGAVTWKSSKQYTVVYSTLIKESLVKTKQKGAILELKQRHLKNIIFCYYTLYPAMKIRRISSSSTQETCNDQFPIRRITLQPYAICTAGRQYVDFYVFSPLRAHPTDHLSCSQDSKKTTMAGPITKEYISTTGCMTYFQSHEWYDELADGKFKDETLALKAIIEGSWEDATPGWKVNTHEIARFTHRENFRRCPYANIKTEWASNPYLDINHIFRRDYKASNIGCTQENHEQKGNLILEPSNCRVRRFKMMKYSFTDNEEYITVKESEYLNHTKDSLDAYQELLRLINEGWVVTTPED
nr:hypothetical protein [Tanacetum cinerariifolium]